MRFTAFELLLALFAISEFFALAACAVMRATRRSSRQWFFATDMLLWSTSIGAVNIISAVAVILLGR